MNTARRRSVVRKAAASSAFVRVECSVKQLVAVLGYDPGWGGGHHGGDYGGGDYGGGGGEPTYIRSHSSVSLVLVIRNYRP